MLMDLDANETLLVEAARTFAERTLAPQVRPFLEAHEFPSPLVTAFGERGFFGTAYDAAYSGSGFGARGAALVAEVLARTEPSFAAIYLCHSAPASVLDRYGSDEIKKEWLIPANEGRMIASFGVTEPPRGSDVASIRTRAVQDGSDFVISGAKVFSTNAGAPLHGFSTVLAVTDPGAGPRALSTFLVPVGTPGFSLGKPGRKIGWRFADSVELHFDSVRVPLRYLIGERGAGLKQILTVLSIGRILVAATGLGLARRAVDLAKAYGRERKLFGVGILEHQGPGLSLSPTS
ncbi:MAG: acyl-CoA dehydrogenase family protein [Gammaproteobacteria bacterium]|nr:acyl-CoA dehydrogenase family protein [Gammaproteobacteria bacterium]